MKLSLKRIGFVVKHHQPEAAGLASDLAEFCLTKKREVYFADESGAIASTIKKITHSQKVFTIAKDKLQNTVDLIVVVGGDGTYLSIARLGSKKNPPIMGINMGQLGFLTEIKKEEAYEVLGDLLRGKVPTLSERELLEVILKRNGKVVFKGPVVNDAVISKGAIARIIGMQVTVNGKLMSHVRADGIIVSTPTGSTAYSLAAGGPIVHPKLQSVILAPICPHSLTQRPIVLPSDSEITIRLSHRPGHVVLTLDGQAGVDLKENDVITIRKMDKHALRLISSPSRDYFSLLREKLKFGQRE